MTAFATAVHIARPIETVYAYLADPLNPPRWNSAVEAVWQTGSTYAMERVLPGGRARNGLEIFTRTHPTDFGIRTTSGATPFTYRYRLAAENAETVVRLDAESRSKEHRHWPVRWSRARSNAASMRTSPSSSRRWRDHDRPPVPSRNRRPIAATAQPLNAAPGARSGRRVRDLDVPHRWTSASAPR